MSDYVTKRIQALDACNKVVNGIEDGTLSVSSSLLLCMRIARLVNDQDGLIWLEYEYGGYPQDTEGSIRHDACRVGAKHARTYREKNKDGKSVEYMFTELCGELEVAIETDKNAIGNYSTQGYSVSGDYALVATSKMTTDIAKATNSLLQQIKTSERRLSILKAEYYNYAVRLQIELQFGSAAKTVFEQYQEKVDNYFSSLPTTTLQKLNAIEDLMEDENPEVYAQVLTSCRRLWSEFAKTLFIEVLPNYHEKTYKTVSG